MSAKTERKGKTKRKKDAHKVGQMKVRLLREQFVVHIPDISIETPGRYHIMAKVTEVHYLRKK